MGAGASTSKPAKKQAQNNSHMRHTSANQLVLLREIFKFFAYRMSKLQITDMSIAIEQGIVLLKAKVPGWFCACWFPSFVMCCSCNSTLTCLYTCAPEFPEEHEHEALIKQKAKSFKDLEDFHNYCKGLEWDTNLLACIYTALNPKKDNKIYQTDDDVDYYQSGTSVASLAGNGFSDDEDENDGDDDRKQTAVQDAKISPSNDADAEVTPRASADIADNEDGTNAVILQRCNSNSPRCTWPYWWFSVLVRQ